jgi:hypothetical protein
VTANEKYGVSREGRRSPGGEAYDRYGRHKSGQAESRTRKVRPRARHGKSEQLEGSSSSASVDPERTPLAEGGGVGGGGGGGGGVEVASTPLDPAILEREAKRKEIQSLIMKYAALDDIYGKSDSTADAQQHHYYHQRLQQPSRLAKTADLSRASSKSREDLVDVDDFVVVAESATKLGKHAPIVSSLTAEGQRGAKKGGPPDTRNFCCASESPPPSRIIIIYADIIAASRALFNANCLYLMFMYAHTAHTAHTHTTSATIRVCVLS